MVAFLFLVSTFRGVKRSWCPRFAEMFLMTASPNGGLLWQDEKVEFETIRARTETAPSGKWVTEKRNSDDAAEKLIPETSGHGKQAPDVGGEKCNPKTLGNKDEVGAIKRFRRNQSCLMAHDCSCVTHKLVSWRNNHLWIIQRLEKFNSIHMMSKTVWDMWLYRNQIWVSCCSCQSTSNRTCGSAPVF